MQKTTYKRKPSRTTRALRNGHSTHALNGFKNSINGFGGELSDKTARIVAKSIRKARTQSKRVGRYVAKKPYRSLGLAVAACLVIGYLANR